MATEVGLSQKEWQHGLHNLRGVKEMAFMQQELSPGPANYKAADLKKAKGVTKWVIPSTGRRLAKAADETVPSYMKETKAFTKKKGIVEGVAYSPRREERNTASRNVNPGTPRAVKRTLTPRKTPRKTPTTVLTPSVTPTVATATPATVFDRLYQDSTGIQPKNDQATQSPYQSPRRIPPHPLVLPSDHPAFGHVSESDKAAIQEKIRQLNLQMSALNRQISPAGWVPEDPTMSPSPSPCIAPERFRR
eukprot:TRINITY_DN220_c1_g2_i1.p1 TRINITY_DN220_c1_g2~~TRINITY_DN220_c1_g2_i1.p1  ORF type:complete len:248 (+),score=41.96 TRINITY_DN220_c1_g2_i1:56-799(+)